MQWMQSKLVMMWLVAAAITCAAQSQKAATSEQPQETIKVDVDVVNMLFNVKDGHGALIPNLKKEDFTISEDGTPQTIKYFSASTNLPLTLGIMIDTSGSQMNVLDMEKQVGGHFLKEVITPKDPAFVINFDVNVEELQDLTSDVSLLKKGLNSARINTGGSVGGIPGVGQGPIPISHPKGTLLNDAVYVASREVLSHEVGRKALILLTDGEDYGSKMKIEAAIEQAQKADAICYVLLVVDRSNHSGFGEGDMRKLTEQTGGRVFNVGDHFDKLEEAFQQIQA